MARAGSVPRVRGVLGVAAWPAEAVVIDARVGAIVKIYMGELLDAWLKDDSKLEQWSSGKLPAWERRLFMTTWQSEAWEQFCNNVNIDRMLHKIDTSLTVDGSRDAEISIQGAPGYTFCAGDAGEREVVSDSQSDNGSGLCEEEDPEDGEDEVSGSGAENGGDGDSSAGSSAEEQAADFMIDSKGWFLCPSAWTLLPMCPDFWTVQPKAQAMKEVKKLKYRLVYKYDSTMWCSAVLKKYGPRPGYYTVQYDVDGVPCYHQLDS